MEAEGRRSHCQVELDPNDGPARQLGGSAGPGWAVMLWYVFIAALFDAAGWPLVAALTGSAPAAVCSGAALLTVGLGLAMTPARMTALPGGRAWRPAATAALPGLVLLAVGVMLPVLRLLGAPYAWLAAVWTGPPDGVGLAPAATGGAGLADSTAGWAGFTTSAPDASAAAGLALCALAVVATAYAAVRRIGPTVPGLAAGAPVALLLTLVATGARWPAVAMATLLVGAVLSVLAAVTPLPAVSTVVVGGPAPLYLGAGLAGCLAGRWSTLSALALVAVAGAVVAVAGRGRGWRRAGWLVLGAAVAAGLAAAALARLA